MKEGMSICMYVSCREDEETEETTGVSKLTKEDEGEGSAVFKLVMDEASWPVEKESKYQNICKY